MIHQNGKFATFAIIGIVAAVFVFSLYVLLTTKNTIIVVNPAARQDVPTSGGQAGPPQSPPTSAKLGRGLGGEASTTEAAVPVSNPRIEILDTGVGFLNVRNGASTSAAKIGTVKPGEVYEYTEAKDNWYHIVHPTLQTAWVFGQYAKVVDRSSDLFGNSPAELGDDKTAP